LGVEEVLEVVLEGVFAALEVEPDGVWFRVVVSASAVRGCGAVEEHAVDVAGEGRGLEASGWGEGCVSVFLVAVEHL
jgi:hypothetical protein